MKIKVIEDIDIDTDDYSDEDLKRLHAYYYQQDLKITAQKCLDAIEERNKKVKKAKQEADEE